MKLINVDDIAKLIKKTRRNTLERIVKQTGFPRPIVPGKGALWDESEVMNFFIKNRKAA